MSIQMKYAPGEIVRRGKALYERELRAQLEPGNIGKYLALNVETGEWEMGEDHSETVLRARGRFPEAGIYGLRIGYKATESLGGGLRLIETGGHKDKKN